MQVDHFSEPGELPADATRREVAYHAGWMRTVLLLETVDLGEPDESLWAIAQQADGGTSLVVGAASWRAAVDAAAEIISTLLIQQVARDE